MTIPWAPTLAGDTPRYLALADAIAESVDVGDLNPGDRLPTHRELAKQLGVTVGTVSRGYAEAEQRGLIAGEVGRGTFVRPARSPDPWGRVQATDEASSEEERTPSSDAIVDLTFSLPTTLPHEGDLLARTLRDISRDAHVARFLDYHSATALHHQRAAASRWLERVGLSTTADDVMVTAGSQHGLNVALSAVFSSGQTLLTGALTYPSIKSQARALGLRLQGLELDHEGVTPESLEQACVKEPKAAGLYLVPTLQNPTVATMSTSRRRDIARLAKKYDLWIIEDDIHAFLPERPYVPIAAEAPEKTIYLSSVGKCLAPGLRTGYAVAPVSVRGRLVAAIHSTIWMAAPLMAELTTRWIASGVADSLIAAKRRESAQRHALVKRYLASAPHGTTLRSSPSSYHYWLELPEPLHADDIVAQAGRRGVHLLGAGAFAVGRRHIPHAIRFCTGQPSRSALERGLAALVDVLLGGGTPAY
ncbi:MAG: PLP-dependent aminotransferase family protein [Acidobacteriota bacterium]